MNANEEAQETVTKVTAEVEKMEEEKVEKMEEEEEKEREREEEEETKQPVSKKIKLI